MDRFAGFLQEGSLHDEKSTAAIVSVSVVSETGSALDGNSIDDNGIY